MTIEIENPLTATSLEALILNIGNFIYTIALGFFPLMIIIAGFFFLTSAGDPERANTAKKIIFWTIVGFIIISLSRGLIEFLKKIFL